MVMDDADRKLVSRLIEATGLLSLVITKFRLAMGTDPLPYELNDILEKSLIAVAEASRLLNERMLVLPGEKRLEA
jgi:hypothetical protein